VTNTKLVLVLRELKKSVQDSLDIANKATQYKELRKGKYRPISKPVLYSLKELSFLKLFISWEHFLEQSFIRFMCGAKNSAGFPEETYANPKSLEHALSMLKQKQRYIDWTIVSDVIERAKLYFKNGEPFSTALGQASTYLTEMKVIRNRIVHESKKAEEDFHDLVRQKFGHFPRGMVPGKLLMSNFSANKTLLEQYEIVVLTVAETLVG
jgi:hypothetical protein